MDTTTHALTGYIIARAGLNKNTEKWGSLSATFDDSPWVEKAWQIGETKRFFRFARFPVGRDLGVGNGKRRVEFFDLRFGQLGGRRPFRYVVDFDEAGRVAFQRFL